MFIKSSDKKYLANLYQALILSCFFQQLVLYIGTEITFSDRLKFKSAQRCARYSESGGFFCAELVGAPPWTLGC